MALPADVYIPASSVRPALSEALPAAPPTLEREAAGGASAARIAVCLLGGMLAVIAVIQCSLALAAILQPREILYSEAIVYDKAARLLRGEPLYQPLNAPPYSVAAYTPLYYWVAAGTQWAFGPGFGPGRLLSYAAGIASAVMVGCAAGRLARSHWAGWFAGLLFLALGLPSIWPFIYREHVPGVALSLAAVVALLGGVSPRRVILAGLLAGLAILTKQTLTAAAFAGFVWLWRRDRALAALFAATSLVVVVGTCLALELSTHAFLANAVYANVNPMGPEALLATVPLFLLFQGGPLAAVLLHFLDRRQADRGETSLFTWYWLGSLFPLLGLAKVGASHNYWIECAAATAVLASNVVWNRLRRASGRRGVALTPIVLLAVSITLALYLIARPALPTFRALWPTEAQVEGLAHLVERVRSESGQVLAEPLDVVVLADRPILLEPHIFSILHREGQWDATQITQSICVGEVTLLVLDRRLESGDTTLHGYSTWPAPIYAALSETMVLEAEQAGRFLYVPRQRAGSASFPDVFGGPCRRIVDVGA